MNCENCGAHCIIIWLTEDVYGNNYCPQCGELPTRPEPLRLEAIADLGRLPIYIKLPTVETPEWWNDGLWVFLRTHKQAQNGATTGYIFADAYGEFDFSAGDYGKTWLAYSRRPKEIERGEGD